ncbi:MAG: hypothetical protein Q4E60_09570 [Bacteroidales bacterium]|nr:hypothetical protein [Bacteroidales bacterium]
MTFFKTAFFAVASLACFAACTDDVVFDEITEPETVQVENNAFSKSIQMQPRVIAAGKEGTPDKPATRAYSKSRQIEPRCIAAGRGSTSRPTR